MIETSGLQLYGIIGHPIGQSLSPMMHNAAFEVLGIHATMQAFDIVPESLHDALESFVNLKFGGMNVTVPHKQAIIPYLQYVDEEASIIGAVNTVKIEEGSLRGFNTDSYGFRQSLEPYRTSIEGSQFLVLGAGGAARAVVYVLLKFFRTSQIIVVSRTASTAKDLVEHFKGFHGSKLASTTFDDPQLPTMLGNSGVVIHATPVGMHPNPGQVILENLEFHKGQTVVDLIYRPLRTEFLRRAEISGARTISGLEMFIHQGARAFELWTGQQMDIKTIRPLLVGKLEKDPA